MTDSTLDTLQAAQKVGRLVVVDFNTSWCGPCRAMKPVLTQLASEYKGRVAIVLVDCEKTPQNRSLASEAAVRCHRSPVASVEIMVFSNE